MLTPYHSISYRLDALRDTQTLLSPVTALKEQQTTNNRFTAGLEYVQVHPGQQVPER